MVSVANVYSNLSLTCVRSGWFLLRHDLDGDARLRHSLGDVRVHFTRCAHCLWSYPGNRHPSLYVLGPCVQAWTTSRLVVSVVAKCECDPMVRSSPLHQRVPQQQSCVPTHPRPQRRILHLRRISEFVWLGR